MSNLPFVYLTLRHIRWNRSPSTDNYTDNHERYAEISKRYYSPDNKQPAVALLLCTFTRGVYFVESRCSSVTRMDLTRVETKRSDSESICSIVDVRILPRAVSEIRILRTEFWRLKDGPSPGIKPVRKLLPRNFPARSVNRALEPSESVSRSSSRAGARCSSSRNKFSSS